jgi:hypothetical protein
MSSIRLSHLQTIQAQIMPSEPKLKDKERKTVDIYLGQICEIIMEI